jgi:tRNA1Val (adenine37-N6)-methyltransferase
MNRAKHAKLLEITKFFKLVNSLLTANGKLWIILPHASYDSFKKIAIENDLYPSEIIHIHAKFSKPNKRIIICFKRVKTENFVEKELVIRNENNDYTTEYKDLTKEFHFAL